MKNQLYEYRVLWLDGDECDPRAGFLRKFASYDAALAYCHYLQDIHPEYDLDGDEYPFLEIHRVKVVK